MGIFVWSLLAVLVAACGLVTLLYLRSGYLLLERVRQDDVLWKSLGCPEKVHGRDFANRYSTIRPLGLWLAWVYAGDTGTLDRETASRLIITRNMLFTAVLLFAAASVVGSLALLLEMG